MAARTNSPRDSVLARANRLLRAFTEDDPVLDLAELVVRSGLTRSTTHRLAAELVSLGLLEKDARNYRVGSALWEIGELSVLSLQLREIAQPHLLDLYDATRENVHLAVLSANEALYVARLAGQASVPTLSRMGGRLPLHTTGVGKALLATMEEASLASYFREPRERETMHSIVDETMIRAEILRAREQGYSTTRQEMTLGNFSVAAAIPAIDGLPRAAVGIVTHIASGDERRIAPLVIRTADAIGEDLSHWVG